MSPTAPRYLIVSLGSIGQRHLRNLCELEPHAEIAVLRLSAHTKPDLPDQSVIYLASIEDVAAFAPRAAIIAGPATTHVSIATKLISLGIPVLIEKPLSHDMNGLAALADMARATNVAVMIAYNMRFTPALAAAREMLLGGIIGDVMLVRAEVGQYLPDWRSGADYRRSVSAQHSTGGGALLELSHEIDYIYWILGMPVSVSCRGGRFSNLEIDVEDAVELSLEYASPRRLVSIHMDFLQRRVARGCKFIGSRGTLTWNGIEDRIELSIAEPEERFEILSKPMADRNEMYLEELRQFLRCVETGEPAPIDLGQGIDVMTIIAAARESMRSGQAEQPLRFAEGCA